MVDKVQKGRHRWVPHLENLDRRLTKLTPEQREEMRRLYGGRQHRHRPKTGLTTREIAERFGVSNQRVSQIVNGTR